MRRTGRVDSNRQGTGPGERWLLLHGTLLTPQVWDGDTGHLHRYGPAWAAVTAVAPLFAEGVA